MSDDCEHVMEYIVEKNGYYEKCTKCSMRTMPMKMNINDFATLVIDSICRLINLEERIEQLGEDRDDKDILDLQNLLKEGTDDEYEEETFAQREGRLRQLSCLDVGMNVVFNHLRSIANRALELNDPKIIGPLKCLSAIKDVEEETEDEKPITSTNT